MSMARYATQLLSLAATALAITSEEASLIAWKAYGDAIKNFITAGQPLTPGSDFLYVLPPTMNFVRGGTPCPESITNFELYNVVDPLQNSSNPLLSTDGPSYSQSLETWNRVVTDWPSYLQSVAILDKELTPEQKAKLDGYEQALTAAKQKWQREKSTAFLAWRNDEVAQYFNQSFQAWVADNDPQYANFQAQMVTADATYNNYMLSIYGSKYNLIQEQRTNINSKAQNELASVPGYNMMVYPASSSYSVKIAPFQKNEITDFVAYKPAYTLASYEDTCDAYFKGTAGQTKVTYDFKQTDGHDWSTLGYTQKVRSYGGGFWSILGYKQSATSEVTHFNSWSNTWYGFSNGSSIVSQEVKITLAMGGAPTVVPINAGFWDVGNVRSTYPKLRANETDDLVGHVRLTHALVAYKVSMQIEFTNTETWKNVTQFIEKGKTNKGGGLHIFGFSFGAGGGGAYQFKTDDLKTSSTTNGGLITIPTTPEGMIFMLGARGKAL